MDPHIVTDEGVDCSVIEVGGEIDVYTAPQMRDAISDALQARPRVVVDTTRVTFMDSTGINVLFNAHKQATENGGWLRLVAREGTVLKVLRLCGLDTKIPVFSSVDDAQR
ncbi:MAG: anti-sigma factor antagonist [Streptosporangiales bacterium]|nr:anti-sigma factor antagonist [Streptosporangiales bacterium]